MIAVTAAAATVAGRLRHGIRHPGLLDRLRHDASVVAVVPALDEAQAIAAVIRELHAVGIVDVVVVDGGSSDGTADAASHAGARVIHEPRRGYGRACAAGTAASDADVIVFLDGDGSDDPAFVPALVDAIVRDGAALALGVRSLRDAGAMLPHQLIGTRLVAALTRHVHGVRIDDVPPLRAIRRDVLERLELRGMTYGWPTEMIVKTARAGLPIAQIEVRARRRNGGESKIAGRLVPSLVAGVRMVGVVLRHA